MADLELYDCGQVVGEAKEKKPETFIIKYKRGPASTVPSLIFRPISSRCIRTTQARDVQQCISRGTYAISPRLFGTSTKWSQFAAAATAHEDEAIQSEIEQTVIPPSNAQTKRPTSYGPVTQFKELAERGMVSATVIDTITRQMGLETMTHVQSLTINEILKGQDVIAQARTGTGKTLAFLLPVIQNIINYDPKLETRSRLGRSGRSTDIRAIIISPTRELAEQIAVEARKATKDTGIIVQTAVGGSAKAFGLRKIKMEGCHILVGTPGRLKDILSDPYSQVRAPNLSAFVLDEADRLLDQGFEPEIQAIQDCLPNRREMDRQTLLFSATVPREVMDIVRRVMKPNFKFVRTVQEGEQQTHERVPQKFVNVGGMENYMPTLVELCKREMEADPDRPFKAIVYFSATAEVALACSMLNNLRDPGQSIFHQHPLHPLRIIEMHARLSQEGRTRAANSFRRVQSAIMISSDVTARGMDFPNVTHVIQIGLPPSEEQYVHRIGRTARGDKTGEGWLLLSNLETREMRKKLRNMPLTVDNTLETAKVDMTKDAQLPEHVAKILTQVGNAAKMVPRELKAAAYRADLGVYSYVDGQRLIDALNDRAKYGWGMESPPPISPGLANKLGLGRVRGINLGHDPEEGSDRGSRSSFGGGDRRGGYGGGGRSFSGEGGRGGYSRGRDSGFSGGDQGGYSRDRDSGFGEGRGGRPSRGREGGYAEGRRGFGSGSSRRRPDDFVGGRGAGFNGSYGRGTDRGFGGRYGGGRDGGRESAFDR